MAIRIPVEFRGRQINLDISNNVDEHGVLHLFRDLLAELEDGDASARQGNADRRLGRLLGSAIGDFHNNYSHRSLEIIERYVAIRDDIAAHRVVEDSRVRQLLEELRELDEQILETPIDALRHEEPTSDSYPNLQREADQLRDFVGDRLPSEVRRTQSWLFERVEGLLETEIVEDLDRINPNLMRILEQDFRETSGLRTLRFFIENRDSLTAWEDDAVRGLATMLRPTTGISPAAVHRLFRELNPTELRELFGRFQYITEMPGANLLVGREIEPHQSHRLIETYASLRRRNFRLPPQMDEIAVIGLSRLIDGEGIEVRSLRAARGQSLEHTLRARMRVLRPTDLIEPSEEIVRRYGNIEGIELLGRNDSNVVDDIEAYAQTHGGHIYSSAREALERRIREYQRLVGDLQAARTDAYQGIERNIRGRRAELLEVIAELGRGHRLIIAGRSDLMTAVIDPSLYELPHGYVVSGAPREVAVEVDVGAITSANRWRWVEVGSGHLGLPTCLRRHLSEPPRAGGEITWDTPNIREGLNSDATSARKWQQIIKMRAVAMTLSDLLPQHIVMGEGAPLTPQELSALQHLGEPELVFRVSTASRQAIEFADELGVRVQTTSE